MGQRILLFFAVSLLHAQVSLTTLGTPHKEDFNSLINTGNSAVLPPGWLLLETGTSPTVDQKYTASTGALNSGDAYSFGAPSSTERAYGMLQSGTNVATIGAAFTNNTGSTVTSLTITYTGEQWRLGATGRNDRLDFQYSPGATSLSSGTWLDVDALDFIAPNATGTIGELDGNLPANRATVTFTIAGLNIANGATFAIRWNDFNANGADDGLAIDDFSLTPNGTVSGTPNLTINDVTVIEGNGTEGNAATTNATFTVSLSSPAPAGGVTFRISTADGTATAGSDYVAQTLDNQTIPAGGTSYTFTVLVNGDTSIEPDETFLVNITNITAATAGDTQGLGTILNDDFAPVTLTAIHIIQGSGIESLLTGQIVTTSGVVTARTSNGYFLQTPDALVDNDENTSEGIFVFTSSTPTVAVGQFVQSTGLIVEFRPATDPKSRSITELTQSAVAILKSGEPLPAAVMLTAPTPEGGIDQLERFEGMRVAAPDLTVVAPTSGTINEPNATSTSNGVLFAVGLDVAQPRREAGIDLLNLPSNPETACAAGVNCALPVFDANPERIRIDTDGILGQTALDVNTGATLWNVIGVLHYGFRAYTILPTEKLTVSGTPVTVTAAPIPAADTVAIAAMNVERLFDTVDDPGVSDVVVTAAAFKGRLQKISKTIRDLLRSPDVVALEEVENLNVAQSLAMQVNNDSVAEGSPNPGYRGHRRRVSGEDIYGDGG